MKAVAVALQIAAVTVAFAGLGLLVNGWLLFAAYGMIAGGCLLIAAALVGAAARAWG